MLLEGGGRKLRELIDRNPLHKRRRCFERLDETKRRTGRPYFAEPVRKNRPRASMPRKKGGLVRCSREEQKILKASQVFPLRGKKRSAKMKTKGRKKRFAIEKKKKGTEVFRHAI